MARVITDANGGKQITIHSVQLKIQKMVYGGDGLARLAPDERGPGKSVFVPFVLPGETVEAQLIEQKAGFARARLERVIEPDAARVQPGCPYFQRCGGCHYQHVNYEQQLAIKTGVLKETLLRSAKIELPCELQVHPSPEWNYRNRTRLKVQTSPEFALGYYRFRSHELRPVEQCPISSPLINRTIAELWEAGRAGKVPAHLREVEFLADAADESLLIELYCAPGTSRRDARECAEAIPQLLSNVHGGAVFEQLGPNQMNEPRHLAQFGNASLDYKVQDFSYRVSAGAFFQVNRFLLSQLIEIASKRVSGKLALDLYAGVGLFSAVLARSFAQVIAVEASQTSQSDLLHNCGQEVKAARATTETYLKQTSELAPDFVVADPPRGGLGEAVVRSLAGMRVPLITYVSCDPSTLARDLRIFVALGYRIDQAHLIDLFPQTFHIESVFRLTR